jgi:hypothetical protein
MMPSVLEGPSHGHVRRGTISSSPRSISPRDGIYARARPRTVGLTGSALPSALRTTAPAWGNGRDDDIAEFVDEQRVIRELERLAAVRLQAPAVSASAARRTDG